MTLVGAAVTARPGETWPEAIASFEDVTGRAMPVRRVYDSGVPATLGASTARHDLGRRASVLSIKPTLSTPLTALEGLAESIAESGHDCDVIIYHEPVDNMRGEEFVELYRRSAPPLRAAGVPVGVCFTNWSCNLPYSHPRSALRRYWPGDRLVDFLAIDEYPIGDFAPMEVRGRRVAQFADARGIPLGLAEFGVAAGWDAAGSEGWLRSVTDWAARRAGAGVPLRWLCYFHSSVGGDYWLTAPEHVDAYVDACGVLG